MQMQTADSLNADTLIHQAALKTYTTLLHCVVGNVNMLAVSQLLQAPEIDSSVTAIYVAICSLWIYSPPT